MIVSVIIPTFKPKDYLWECLDSIVNQEFNKRDYEVVLILNGCSEPYNTAIVKYIQKHPDVQWKYIKLSQGGVSNARNIGLDNATGEYVTFIDDDDYVSHSYLSELYEQATADIVSLCYPLAFNDGCLDTFQYRITRQYEKYAGSKMVKFYRVRRFFDGPVYKLIHKSIIGDRRFDNAYKNGEDTLFMFLISDRIKYVNLTSRNAVYYRRVRLGSATSTITAKDNICNLFRLINEYTKIYIGGIYKYNFSFYLTRILGAIRSIISK